MSWILLGVLVLVTAGLGCSVYLLFSLKRLHWELEQKLVAKYESLQAEYGALHADFEKLRAEAQDLEQRAGMLVAPSPALSGLDLNKRTHAVRMLSEGDEPGRVAAALCLPRAETDLLKKVTSLRAAGSSST